MKNGREARVATVLGRKKSGYGSQVRYPVRGRIYEGIRKVYGGARD